MTTTLVESRPSRIQHIAASKLRVFIEVQRDVPSAAKVREIVSKFNPNGLGVLTVSHRGDGVYSLVDGQRRVAALKVMGMELYSCECKVYEGMTLPEEAAMFRVLNATRIPGKFDDFRVGLTENDPECLAISAIAGECGFRVTKHQAVGCVTCVAVMRKVWRSDGNGALLRKSLACAHACFGDSKRGASGNIVGGFAAYFTASPDAQMAKVVEKVRAKFASPDGLVARARSRGETEGGTISKNVATIVARVYAGRKLGV